MKGALRQDLMFFVFVTSGLLLWPQATAGLVSSSRDDANSGEGFAPALLEFATELKSLVTETTSTRQAVEQWCQESQASKASFAQVLKHDLSEQEATLKQVRLEARRLSHELKLTAESRLERRRRLASTAAAQGSSAASLRREEQQLGQASGSVTAATDLIHARQTGATSDATLSEDGDSMAVRAGSVLRDGLAEKLRVATRLIGQERTVAHSDLGSAVAAEAAYLERLNASVLEADFEVAFLQGEVSHRQRREVQLETRSSSTSTILEALLESQRKTAQVCQQEDKHTTDFSALVEKEKALVADLLRSLPSSQGSSKDADSDADAGVSFLQLGTSSGAVAYRRFAARQLRGLSRQHPLAEHLLEGAVQQLLRGLQEMADAEPAAAALASPAASHASVAPQHDALASISSFVGQSSSDLASGSSNSSERESAEDVEMRRQVNALYANLSQQLLAKGEELAESRRHCSLLSRQAKVEHSAAHRSATSAQARLHQATAAASELAERAAKFQSEHDALEKQLKSLQSAARVAANQQKEGGGKLQAISQKLLVAAAQGGQAAASASVQQLAQQAEAHRTLLADRSAHLGRAAAQVAAHDELLLAFLKEEARQTSRDQRRNEGEAALLKGELEGKVEDERLAKEFQTKSLSQCSPAMVQKLEKDTADLTKLAAKMTVLQQNDLDLADDPEAVDAQGLQPLTK